MNIDRATAAQARMKHLTQPSGPPVRSSELVRCEVWSVQQLAAGGMWNTILAENSQGDAERAVERLAKSGERNLRIQVTRAPNDKVSCGGQPEARDA